MEQNHLKSVVETIVEPVNTETDDQVHTEGKVSEDPSDANSVGVDEPKSVQGGYHYFEHGSEECLVSDSFGLLLVLNVLVESPETCESVFVLHVDLLEVEDVNDDEDNQQDDETIQEAHHGVKDGRFVRIGEVSEPPEAEIGKWCDEYLSHSNEETKFEEAQDFVETFTDGAIGFVQHQMQCGEQHVDEEQPCYDETDFRSVLKEIDALKKNPFEHICICH
jgi:hypothetical protein